MRTFAAVHGVGESTLLGLQPRARGDSRYAHRKKEEGGSKAPKIDVKTISVTAWMLAYADEVGDLMPDECARMTPHHHCRCAIASRLCVAPLCSRSGDVIIPVRNRHDEWEEYKDGRDADEAASYSHFCEVIRSADELQHIKQARKCLNFQHCKECVQLNARYSRRIQPTVPPNYPLHTTSRPPEGRFDFSQVLHRPLHPETRSASLWPSANAPTTTTRRATSGWSTTRNGRRQWQTRMTVRRKRVEVDSAVLPL